MSTNAANIVMGPATLSVGGTDVGFTRDGISARMPREYRDIKADQAMGTIVKKKVDEQFFIRTTLLEATIANVYAAWDQNIADVAEFGSDTADVQEVALIVVGPGPNGTTRTLSCAKCVSIGESQLQWNREEETAMEVEFEALKADGTGALSLGAFGTLVDAA